MTKTWLHVLALWLLLVSGVAAAESDTLLLDDTEIEQMELPELQRLVDLVTATVGQETLLLQPTAVKQDCLELVRLSNSIALGYRYLGQANETLTDRTSDQEVTLKVKVLQSRVIAFASMVRASDWVRQFCGAYTVPADKADDPRYEIPLRPGTRMFSRAVIEARQVAEINLAGAVAAGRSGQCPQIVSAHQSLRLLVPYVEKLLNDMRVRPQALGPQASRLALQQMRNQLVGAIGQLDGLAAQRCQSDAPAPIPPPPEQG